MITKPFRTHLLTRAVAIALVAATPQLASAQDASAAPANSSDAVTLDNVVVTGSRIRSKNLMSSTPVTRISQDTMKISGSLSVEDYLNTLPQLVAGNTKSSNVFGDSDQTSTLNLRGLGAKRSLLLVNGKRFIGPGPNGVVDVNNIPASMVDRVEIVTGGGSAVYGSDAMAGVVNFAAQKYVDGLNDLIRNHSRKLANALVVHWF